MFDQRSLILTTCFFVTQFRQTNLMRTYKFPCQPHFSLATPESTAAWYTASATAFPTRGSKAGTII